MTAFDFLFRVCLVVLIGVMIFGALVLASTPYAITAGAAVLAIVGDEQNSEQIDE